LVADLNPGVLGSYPTNLTDVGGVLYFTANAGGSGTTLYRTTGEGVETVGNISGLPTQFVAQLGSAKLTSSQPGPEDGVPDVDYQFTLELQRADGSVDTVE